MPKRSTATRQPPAKLRNIGPKTLARLAEIGVSSLDDLRVLGAVDTYRRLKFRFPCDVSLNALYALEAALLDCHWRDLPAGRKAELKRATEV
jgi:DNA transformation protein